MVVSSMAPNVHVLQFVKGKYAGQEFALEPSESYIAGRSSEADVVLEDDAVSRKHARFFTSRGRTWLRDLGSRNGTKVNGESVDRYCLRNGDRVAIGSSLIKVIVAESSQVSGKWQGKKKKSAGAADEGTAGRSMSGSIEDIPLVDVLQWLATSRKTGTLKVRSPSGDRTGALHLRDGQVFYATIEGSKDLPPQKALMRMLLWDKGMFELDSNVIQEAPSELQSSLEHLLMEAARQQDELAALAAKTRHGQAGHAFAGEVAGSQAGGARPAAAGGGGRDVGQRARSIREGRSRDDAGLGRPQEERRGPLLRRPFTSS